jgi:arylsulfatase A-like enzyme
VTSPNIVFIMSDDHAAHAISAYGSKVNRTPQLDRLAAQGVRMDATYCTNSICSPSRASILTGTYSHINGVASIFTEIDYRIPTFAEVLHDAGYQTALFGKWHLGERPESAPRHFDAWKVFPGQGDYVDPLMIGPDGAGTVPGYATDIVTDQSIDWIRDRDPDRPFLLLVHHKAPHRPWVPDEKHKSLYPLGSIPEPSTLFDDNSTRSRAVRGVRMSVADDLSSDELGEELPAELRGPENRVVRMRWKYQRYLRDYLQCVQSIDDNVGRLLDTLDAEGLAEDTVVVYTSDQGFFLGDHGWFDKRLMFDESLQMPMLIRWPAAIPAGRSCDAMVTNVDFAATFLDMAGLDASIALPTSQGRSFLPLLRGSDVPDWPDAVYYRYWEHDDPIHHAPAHYGVRTKHFKLIHYYGAGLGVPGSSDRLFDPEWELYDLRTDPEELVNVADDPAYAEIRASLEKRLSELQSHYADEPYAGTATPRPEWSWADEKSLRAVAEYTKTLRSDA